MGSGGGKSYGQIFAMDIKREERFIVPTLRVQVFGSRNNRAKSNISAWQMDVKETKLDPIESLVKIIKLSTRSIFRCCNPNKQGGSS